METIEQLKQDNAKLQERLNNAAKFFREQKAQIENLTKENDELKHDAESFNSLQESYENKITLLEENNIKLGKDIESFKTQIKEQTKFESDVINTKVPELEEKLKNSEAAYEELRKKYTEIKELHDGDLNRYNELEDNYEKLQNKFKENDIAKGEAELRLENIQTEYIKKFEEQENTIKSKDKAYKLLQDTYNEVFGELNKLKETNKENVELKDKVDKLNKLYDSCENEKLAVQADYETLKEQYKELKINADAYEETTREYEEIYEDYEKYKNFINALFKKAEELNITWKKPEDLSTTDKVKKENKKDNNDSSKVTVEYAKKTTGNTNKGRIINQEMNVPGYTINM